MPVIFIEEKLESFTPITPLTCPCLLTLAVVRLVVLRSLHLHRQNILFKAISLSNNTAFAVLPATPLHQSNFSKYDAYLPKQTSNDDVISPNNMLPRLSPGSPLSLYDENFKRQASSFNQSFHIPCIIQFISRRLLYHSPHKMPEPATLLRFQPT